MQDDSCKITICTKPHTGIPMNSEESSLREEMGALLKAARTLGSYSQRDLASQTQVSHSTISRMENGICEPEQWNLERLYLTLRPSLVGGGIHRRFLELARQLGKHLPQEASISNWVDRASQLEDLESSLILKGLGGPIHPVRVRAELTLLRGPTYNGAASAVITWCAHRIREIHKLPWGKSPESSELLSLLWTEIAVARISSDDPSGFGTGIAAATKAREYAVDARLPQPMRNELWNLAAIPLGVAARTLEGAYKTNADRRLHQLWERCMSISDSHPLQEAAKSIEDVNRIWAYENMMKQDFIQGDDARV